MKLGIDLRFYRPEPYGLAVHIRDLMVELLPLLESSGKFSEITLIFDAKVTQEQLSENLTWWNEVASSSKFKIYQSKSKYYSAQEQTIFLKELYDLDLDLMYFFTFNFPILYNKPFVYQVLDLSIPKTRSHWSPKIQAMLLCFRMGVAKAKHILFLGKNARSDAELFCSYQFENPDQSKFRPNTVIYNGLNKKYLTTPSADKQKAKLIGLEFSTQKALELAELKHKFGITKPYFFFISVWRKYKNIERLAEAFAQFNERNNEKYQLVLGGGQDSKYPEILQFVQNLNQFKQGNIIVTGRVESDDDVIALYDGAEALVAPSLSEGFGLWMAEAASRGLEVIASDIPIFHEIAEDIIDYFDPNSVDDIARSMNAAISRDEQSKNQRVLDLHRLTQKFTWSNTAKQIADVLEQIPLIKK